LGVHTFREKLALVNWAVFVDFSTNSASLFIRGLQPIPINSVNVEPLRAFSGRLQTPPGA